MENSNLAKKIPLFSIHTTLHSNKSFKNKILILRFIFFVKKITKYNE